MNTADLLLANLERLLSSPTSAETIRKLIFDLAIRGQLTTQSDKDEPASVLIAKVIRTAQAEDRKFSAEPAVTERPFELPSGWEWVRLGNTGKIFNGTSASAGEKARLSKTPDGLPFIATKDVGYGRDPLCYENGLKVPHGDKDYKVAKSGAVLICAEGGSAGKKVGQTNRPICFGNKLYANETWAGIEAGYILSLYQSNFFYGEFKAKMTGIIGGIARSEFRSLRIPLPPLAEQKRIVAKVDELMALCDRLEAQLKERDVKQATLAKAALAKFTEDPTPENLQLLFHTSFAIIPADLGKSVLRLGFEGKLVSQSKDEGTGTELLSQIIQAHSGGRTLGSRRKGQVALDPFSCPGVFVIPSSWAWAHLNFLCETIADVDHNMPKAVSVGVPFISAKDLKDDGTIDFSSPKLISEEDFGRLSRKVQIRRDDIIYSRIGARLGKARLVKVDTRFLISYSCCLVRPMHGYVDKRYLQLFLDSTLALSQAHKGAQSIGVPDLGLGEIKAFQIPLPPLAEQRRIVAKVEQLMALVEALETQFEASRTTGEKLLEAMVAELTSA
jgi:type I restriction enzyme, S subunit